MRLPVTTTPADPLTLWRRYADLLEERVATAGEPLDVPQGVGVERPHADWLLGAAGVPARPDRTTVRIDGPADHGSHVLLRLLKVRPVTAVDVTVLPGRAARAAYERLCATRWAETESPLDADAAAHVDDPQCDVLLALDAAGPVASISLQTRGQTGALFDWYVRPDRRRGGVGRAMVLRALELAGRAQLLDLFAGVPVASVAESALQSIGFVPITHYDARTDTPERVTP